MNPLGVERVVPITNSRASYAYKFDVHAMLQETQKSYPGIVFDPVIDIGILGSESPTPLLTEIVHELDGGEEITLIALFGGDGIKTKKVNTLLSLYTPDYIRQKSQILFAHFTFGEFNLEASRYGLQPTANSFITALYQGTITWIDYMQSVVDTEAGVYRPGYFHSLGLFAYSVHAYENVRRPKMTRIEKILRSVLLAATTHELAEIVVENESGNVFFEGSAGLVEVGKGKLIGLDLAGHKPWDREMTTIVVPGKNKREFITNLVRGGMRSLRGDRRSNTEMLHFRGDRVVVLGVRKPTLWHYDAEPGGAKTSAVKVTMKEQSIPFLTLPNSGLIYTAP